MKKINKEFVKWGFNYKQIQRTGDIAIFEQSHSDWRDVRYEVVKIGRHNGYYLGGVKLEAAETYPGASMWGIQGWTYHTLDTAEKKFNELCDKVKKDKNKLQLA